MEDQKDIQKLLLHICCGPCALWPLEDLLEKGLELSLLYFNPNIQPQYEWERRLENAKIVADRYGLPLLVQDQSRPDLWSDFQAGDSSRCGFCYQLRLSRTAEIARREGFDAISTSLLVSPYQKRELILKQGQRSVEGGDLAFMAFDWRDHYRKGQAMARDLGLYRQKYCGCLLSLDESAYAETIRQEHQRLKSQDPVHQD